MKYEIDTKTNSVINGYKRSIIRKLCNLFNTVSTDDLEQKAFIAIEAAKKAYNPTKGTFKTFVYHYIYYNLLNYCNRFINSTIRHVKDSSIIRDDEILKLVASKKDTCKEVEDKMYVASLIKMAPRQYRWILVAIYVLGIPESTLARMLKVSPQSVSVRKFKAINAIKSKLKNDNNE